MVAIGIMVILSISLLIQQNKFDSSVYITNISYEIAQLIGQAQTYSTSSVVGDSSGSDNSSYGVYFEKNNNNIIFYKNEDGNQAYSQNQDSIVETFIVPVKTKVKSICADSNCNKTAVSISFKRPNREPIFSFDGGGNPNSARIIIENSGTERSITVSRTGYIQND